MNNAEWIIKNGYKFSDVCLKGSYDTIAILLNGKNLGNVRGTYSSAFQQWLDMEHKEPILDDEERKYLSAVIKPFRDRVKSICKVNYLGVSSSEYQYLFITLSDGSYNIDLPIFKRGTMYKGMKPAKDYTPEELDL